ncbi:synaptonemal complex protein 2-like [Lissotriton helveticus]
MDLETFINTVFQGNDLQTINELVKEKNENPSLKLSKVMLTTLDKMVNKELDKNAFGHVSRILQCVQQFCKLNFRGSATLIEQGLVSKMGLWFERATDFLNTAELESDHNLMGLVEHFYDTSVALCSCKEGMQQLLDSFILRLGFLATHKKRAHRLRVEALKTLNSIMSLVPWEQRCRFCSSEELYSLTEDLAKAIGQAGDYEIQTGISEALCRLVKKKDRNVLVHKWFDENILAETFQKINVKEFETDCRKFLNDLNTGLGDNRSVYTFPCITAFADLDELRKPVDGNLEEFWVDFNIGSQSITFLIDNAAGTLWDTVTLAKDEVNVYSLKEVDDQKILIFNLKNAQHIHSKPVTKVKILFEVQFDIEVALVLVFGDQNMSPLSPEIKMEPMESLSFGDKNPEIALETNETTFIEWKKKQMNSDKTDSASDILSSQLSDYSMAVMQSSSTPSTHTSQRVTESQDINVESGPETTPDVFRSAPLVMSDEPCKGTTEVFETIEIINEEPTKTGTSDRTKKKKTNSEKQAENANSDKVQISPVIEILDEQFSKNGKHERSKRRKSSYEKHTEDASEQPIDVSGESVVLYEDESKNCTPEKFKRRKSSSKNAAKSKKMSDTYDIMHIFDSPSYDKVSEAKQKILGQPGSSKRKKESSSLKGVPSSTERRVPSNYREHLFSDTNYETASNGSEMSWVSGQKNTLSKSADYTRKKPRTRSRAKVLPLSSPSGAEDHQSKNTDAIFRSTPGSEARSKRGGGNATKLKYSGPVLPGVSPLLTPQESTMKSSTVRSIHSGDQQASDDDLMYGPSSPNDSETFEDVPKKQSFKTSPLHESGFVSQDKVNESNQELPGESLTKDLPSSDDMANTQTPEINLQPRKLFSSEEKSNEASGKVLAEAEDLDTDEEECSDSSVIAAFENFSKDLKQKFGSRYKRMERRAQKTLKTSEQHVSTLLKRVHHCRLSKLDHFRTIVVQELDSLEKETQVLKGLEKTTLEFWKQQSEKLNLFCDSQHQRLQSVDTRLEDTTTIFTEVLQQTSNVEHKLETVEENRP